MASGARGDGIVGSPYAAHMSRRPSVHLMLIMCQLGLAVVVHDQFVALPTLPPLVLVVPALLALLVLRSSWRPSKTQLVRGQVGIHAVLLATPVAFGEGWHMRSEHAMSQAGVAVSYVLALLVLGRALRRVEPLETFSQLRLAASASRRPVRPPVQRRLSASWFLPVREKHRTSPHLAVTGYRAPPRLAA